MKAIAFTLLFALPAFAQDAGVDAGSDAPLRGVWRVAQAEQADGGTLGPGWYLTSDKMLAVGSRVVALDNENRQMKAELLSSPRPSLGFWAGLIVGAAVGVSGTVLIVKDLK